MSRPCCQRNWFFFFRRGHWDDEEIDCSCSVPRACFSGWLTTVGRNQSQELTPWMSLCGLEADYPTAKSEVKNPATTEFMPEDSSQQS
jgi:hypothetical protein